MTHLFCPGSLYLPISLTYLTYLPGPLLSGKHLCVSVPMTVSMAIFVHVFLDSTYK